jgi:hypothetical protein
MNARVREWAGNLFTIRINSEQVFQWIFFSVLNRRQRLLSPVCSSLRSVPERTHHLRLAVSALTGSILLQKLGHALHAFRGGEFGRQILSFFIRSTGTGVRNNAEMIHARYDRSLYAEACRELIHGTA